MHTRTYAHAHTHTAESVAGPDKAAGLTKRAICPHYALSSTPLGAERPEGGSLRRTPEGILVIR